MKSVKTVLITLTTTGLIGSSFTLLAINSDEANVDNIAIKGIPTEVQTGSLKIKQGSGDQAMADLAKINSQKAATIANKVIPGEIIKTELEIENGYLIWKVESINPEQEEIELMIDAGNGDLLAAETEENENDEHD